MSAGEYWTEKMWFVYTVDVSFFRPSGRMESVGKWMQLEITTLYELSRLGKTSMECFLSFVRPRFYRDTQNHLCTQDMDMGVKQSRGRKGTNRQEGEGKRREGRWGTR